MKTLELVQDGHLNLIARKGFQVRFYLHEVPQAGFTYTLIAKDDTETIVFTINGTAETDRVLFNLSVLNIATGPYKYDVIVTKTADSSKRPALSGDLIVTP